MHYRRSPLRPWLLLTLLCLVAAGVRSEEDPSVLPGTPSAPNGKKAAPGEKGTSPGGKSVVPDGKGPAPAKGSAPAAEPSSNLPGKLELRSVTAGAEPYTWQVPGRVAASFITNTPDALTVTAKAQVPGHPELERQIRWIVQPPEGFAAPDTLPAGPVLSVRLRRPAGNPSGGGGPLALRVTARLQDADGEASAQLQQDLRDRLRQEYVDLQRAYVPARSELLDEAEFSRQFGKKYPGISFLELNWSQQPGNSERYPFIMADPKLLEVLNSLGKLYGAPVRLTSGFRNPVHQVEVHAAVEESHHQYGRAADLYVAPDSAVPKTGRTVASELDWLRLAAACLRAGGSWIEPMTDCHVGTDGCHVHVDVRPGGAQSQVVRVSGTVQDPAGRNLAGAIIRLAGMPTVTNSAGAFSLKHVLTPRQYELEVDSPTHGTITQAVDVTGPETKVDVRIPLQPQATLLARIDGVKRWKDVAAVRVVVRNAGFAPAAELKLEAAPPPSLRLQSLQPESVPLLQPGGEAPFTLRLTAPPTMLDGEILSSGVQLTARYQTPGGQGRVQTLPLQPTTPTGTAATAFIPPSAGAADVPASPSRRVRRSPVTSEWAALLIGLVVGGILGALHALLPRLLRETPPSAPIQASSPDPEQATDQALLRLENEGQTAS